MGLEAMAGRAADCSRAAGAALSASADAGTIAGPPAGGGEPPDGLAVASCPEGSRDDIALAAGIFTGENLSVAADAGRRRESACRAAEREGGGVREYE
jgi:hypothetical protein